jgi:hypothetical protein
LSFSFPHHNLYTSLIYIQDESIIDEKSSNLQEVPVEEILELQQKELERLEEKRKIKQTALSKYGFFLSNDQNCFDLE